MRKSLLKQIDKKYENAIKDFTEAIKLQPNSADAYVDRGLARGKREDKAGELVDYQKALQIDSCFNRAYYNRALSYSDDNDLDSALRDYDKAIKCKPDYEFAISNRGQLRYLKKDFDGAG